MKHVRILAAGMAVLGFQPGSPTRAAEDHSDPSRYHVTFGSPSKGAQDSMPLGNGELALNAWFEEKGDLPNPDLLLLLARTDSWGDNGRHLKFSSRDYSSDETGQTLNICFLSFAGCIEWPREGIDRIPFLASPCRARLEI